MHSQYLKPDIGKISKHLKVEELIVRAVPTYGVTPEFDGGVLESESGDVSYEDRLQGRLVNTTKFRLSDIAYDISFYDSADRFLGLNKSRFLEEDEMDIGDYIAIDLKIELPEDTFRCTFNARAKKPGIIGRFFWG